MLYRGMQRSSYCSQTGSELPILPAARIAHVSERETWKKWREEQRRRDRRGERERRGEERAFRVRRAVVSAADQMRAGRDVRRCT